MATWYFALWVSGRCTTNLGCPYLQQTLKHKQRWHPWQQVEKTSWILNCGERAGEDSCAFQLQRFKWRADSTIISDCFWGEWQKWAKAPKSTCPTESILNIAFFNFALLTSCIKVIHPKTAHLSQPKTDENTFQCCPLSFMIRAEVLPSGCSIEVGICLHRRWHLRCRCRTRCQPLHFFKSCTVNYKTVMCGTLHSFCHLAVKIAHLSTFVLFEF